MRHSYSSERHFFSKITNNARLKRLCWGQGTTLASVHSIKKIQSTGELWISPCWILFAVYICFKSFIMPTVIPASLLNMQFHSITNLALGIICFIFQVVLILCYMNVSGSFLIGISLLTYTDCCLGLEPARCLRTNRNRFLGWNNPDLNSISCV